MLGKAGAHSRALGKKVDERLSKPLDALDKRIDKYLQKKQENGHTSMATPSDIKRAGERDDDH
jgi:hypothetical protein